MTPIQQRLALARQFSAHMRFTLSDEELAQVVKSNERDSSKYGDDVCHSHDFCDANMVMLHAWQEQFGRDPDLNSDPDIALWGDAWAIAKATNFTIGH